jgi:O-antigen/teichoic acid export membrane protein
MTAVGAPQAQAGPGGHDDTRRLAGIARSGVTNLAGAVIGALVTLAITVLITRHYAKPVAGAFFSATSLFLVAESAASLGAYVGEVNFIARLRRLGHEDRIPVIVRAAIVPVVFASLAVCLAMFFLARPLAHALLGGHLGKAGADPALVGNSLRVLALALPFAAMSDTLLGATRGYRQMRPTALVDKIGRSAGQLVGVLIAITAGSVALLAPLWAVPYVPAAVAGWWWLRRIRREPRSAVKPAAAPHQPAEERSPAGAVSAGAGLADATPAGFWRFTAPRSLANLAQISIQRIDIVLVAIIRGPAEAAIYTAATRFLVAGQFANTAVNMAAQPRFAELFAVGDRRGAGVIYRVTTAWLIVMTWPLYLLAVIYGPEILSIFGHSYRAGHAVMVILGLTMLVATACGQVDMVLITTGRSSWSLANGLSALVINVGLDVLLIPRFGITGAAVGWAAAIVVTNLVPLVQLAVAVRLHPFGRGTLTAGALSMVSFAVVPIVARLVLGGRPGVSVGAVLVGCGVEAAGLWWFRDLLQLSSLPGTQRLRQIRRGKASAVARPPGASSDRPDGPVSELDDGGEESSA